MNWRRWAYDKLRLDEDLTALVPLANIYGGGALQSAPKIKPFLIINYAPSFRSNVRTSVSSLIVAVHDDPGDYGRIDQTLLRVKELFNNAIPGEPGSTVVEWLTDSQDLADDGYGTIMRNSSYRLIGGTP